MDYNTELQLNLASIAWMVSRKHANRARVVMFVCFGVAALIAALRF